MEQSMLERYYDIKSSQIDMVDDRGYIIPEFEKESIESIDNFETFSTEKERKSYQNDNYWIRRGLDLGMLNSKDADDLVDLYDKSYRDHYLSWHLYWNDDQTKMLLVYYVTYESSIPIAFIRYLSAFIDIIRKVKVNGYNVEMSNILISNSDMSTDSSKNLQNIPNTQFYLEIDMTFNPDKHISNQEHILLTVEQSAELLSELKIDKSKLPSIKIDNPIVKYYGWKVGDILKIKRKEYYVYTLAQESINYRVITNI
jgi:DNA-directed RNA polymerase subunit H (RpoH/RPB5)